MAIGGGFDLEVQRYASLIEKWAFDDSNGDPFDLSPYKAAMQVRKDWSSAEFVVELTTENGGITLSSGLIELYIGADVTATFAADSKWVYDLNLILVTDEENRPPISRGTFKVFPGSTRWT